MITKLDKRLEIIPDTKSKLRLSHVREVLCIGTVGIIIYVYQVNMYNLHSHNVQMYVMLYVKCMSIKIFSHALKKLKKYFSSLNKYLKAQGEMLK